MMYIVRNRTMHKQMIACLLGLALLLCSCAPASVETGNSPAKISVQGKEYDAIGINSVSIPEIGFYAELKNITTDRSELVFRNASTDEQWYPQMYAVMELQSIKDGKAYKMIGELPYSGMFWEDIAYYVMPGEESTQTLRWGSFYGPLDVSGVYLLEKECHCGEKTYNIGIIFTVPQ